MTKKQAITAVATLIVSLCTYSKEYLYLNLCETIDSKEAESIFKSAAEDIFSGKIYNLYKKPSDILNEYTIRTTDGVNGVFEVSVYKDKIYSIHFSKPDSGLGFHIEDKYGKPAKTEVFYGRKYSYFYSKEDKSVEIEVYKVSNDNGSGDTVRYTCIPMKNEISKVRSAAFAAQQRIQKKRDEAERLDRAANSKF